MSNYLIFFAGVLTTLLSIVIINKYKKLNSDSRRSLSQSYLYLIVKRLVPDMLPNKDNKNTQSIIYEDNKVFHYLEMSDSKAYWIDKNKVYCAEIKNGYFNPDDRTLMSMKNLSEKEVNRMLYIFSNLKNG